MNSKEMLILEYAKIVTNPVKSESDVARAAKIADELQMTDKRIIEEATRLAIAKI